MKLIKSIFILFSLTILVSCVKEKDFPPEPKIEFVQYVKYGLDSADCIISFTDGDGDIGIAEGDATTPDDFKMKYLYKGSDNLFHPFDAIDSTAAMDTLFYSYRVPYLTPDGQYKALTGDIVAKLRVPPLYAPGHTVVKFEITLTDRAGHRSNVVTSNEITIP